MSWYVRRGECEIGPLGEDALRALVGTGQIVPDTWLWREGLSHWTAASALPGVLGPRASPPAPGGQTAVAAESDSNRPAPAPSVADAARLELATPWRRYWARSVDLTVSSLLVGVLIAAIRPNLITHPSAPAVGEWLILLLLLPLAFTMDAGIFRAMGNTPGKAVAGIRVLQEGGARPLPTLTYLGRNYGVYVFGLGFGLPLISLFTLIRGYRRAVATEALIWDRICGSRVYAHSAAQTRTWVTAGVYLTGATTLFALGLGAQQNRSRYIPTHAPAVILQQELQQAANRVNASSPRMIDAMTRLDGAYAGPGPLFTYDYTLTKIRVSRLAPGTLQTVRWRLSANVRQAVCAGNALQPMLRAGARVRFYYRDEDGQEVALVSVASADCGS